MIVGGGIIGTSTALFLAQKGIRAVLCEKGHIAGEQSSRNWGWCRKMGRDPRELPLIIESLRLWQGMNEMVEAETGFRQAGIMYLAESQAELGQLESWLDHARQYQLDTRLIGRAEAAELMPGLTGPGRGALYPERRQGRTAEGGAGDRRGGAAAGRHDPDPIAPCAGSRPRAAAWRLRSPKRAASPATPSCWRAARGVGCFAAISASVCRSSKCWPPSCAPSRWKAALKSPLPAAFSDFASGWTAATPSPPSGVRTIDLVPDNLRLVFDYLPAVRLHWKKLRFRVGRRWVEEWRTPRRWSLDESSPFEAMRVLDPEPDSFVIDRARAATAEAFPVFRDAVVAESWGGMIDVMPDAIPVISPVETVPGFFVATGFSGHGFGIGPGAGKLVADMVAGDPTLVDPSPFRLSRFTDGSKPQPHPLAS